jgi:hypothetical protein
MKNTPTIFHLALPADLQLEQAAFNTCLTLLFMDETSTTHTNRLYQALPAEELNSPLLSTFPEDVSRTQQYHVKPFGWVEIAIDAILGPFRLMRHPLFSTVALLSALFYSIQIYMYVDIPATYKEEYGFTPSETGLAFMGTGIGMTIGLLAFGLTSDRAMVMLAAGGERKPEHRLPLMLISSVLVSSGLLVYSLTAHPWFHWILPVIGNGLTGAGLYTISVC